MPTKSRKPDTDDLRPEYDLKKLKGGVRGKHYRQATAGIPLVLLEPDVSTDEPRPEYRFSYSESRPNRSAPKRGRTRNVIAKPRGGTSRPNRKRTPKR